MLKTSSESIRIYPLIENSNSLLSRRTKSPYNSYNSDSIKVYQSEKLKYPLLLSTNDRGLPIIKPRINSNLKTTSIKVPQESSIGVYDLTNKDDRLINNKYHFLLKDKTNNQNLNKNQNSSVLPNKSENSISPNTTLNKYIPPKFRQNTFSSNVANKSKQIKAINSDEDYIFFKKRLYLSKPNFDEKKPRNIQNKAENQNIQIQETSNQNQKLTEKSDYNNEIIKSNSTIYLDSSFSRRPTPNNFDKLITQFSPKVLNYSLISNSSSDLNDKLLNDDLIETSNYPIDRTFNRSGNSIDFESRNKIYDYIKKRENSFLNGPESSTLSLVRDKTFDTFTNSSKTYLTSSFSKKRVSFHDLVIETDVDSGNSVLKPILSGKKSMFNN